MAKTTEQTLAEAMAGVTVTMSTVPSKTSEIVLLPGIRRKTTNDV